MSNHQQELEHTMGCLQRLDDQEQILLGLYYFEKLTVGEIASILQEEPGDVEGRLDEVFAKMDDMPAAAETRRVTTGTNH